MDCRGARGGWQLGMLALALQTLLLRCLRPCTAHPAAAQLPSGGRLLLPPAGMARCCLPASSPTGCWAACEPLLVCVSARSRADGRQPGQDAGSTLRSCERKLRVTAGTLRCSRHVDSLMTGLCGARSVDLRRTAAAVSKHTWIKSILSKGRAQMLVPADCSQLSAQAPLCAL